MPTNEPLHAVVPQVGMSFNLRGLIQHTKDLEKENAELKVALFWSRLTVVLMTVTSIGVCVWMFLS